MKHVFLFLVPLLCRSLFVPPAMFLLPPPMQVMRDGSFFTSCGSASDGAAAAAVRRSAALRRCNFPGVTSSEEAPQTPGGAVQILHPQ